MKRPEPKWKPGASVESNVERELPRLQRAYYKAGDKILRHPDNDEELHQLRLLTKHYRYLLELFEPHYKKQWADYLRQLRALQTTLGDLNDYATTRGMLAGQSQLPRAEQLFAYLDAQRSARVGQLQILWQELKAQPLPLTLTLADQP